MDPDDQADWLQPHRKDVLDRWQDPVHRKKQSETWAATKAKNSLEGSEVCCILHSVKLGKLKIQLIKGDWTEHLLMVIRLAIVCPRMACWANSALELNYGECCLLMVGRVTMTYGGVGMRQD
jgi:hypothetical protein